MESYIYVKVNIRLNKKMGMTKTQSRVFSAFIKDSLQLWIWYNEFYSSRVHCNQESCEKQQQQKKN